MISLKSHMDMIATEAIEKWGENDLPTPKTKYKKNCGDCGQFVVKSRWVRTDDPDKEHPLCSDCFSMYDDPYYY